MTASEAAQHWHDGAKRALKAAQNSFESGDFEIALFTCHLAVEKQLKALYITKKDEDPPKTHNLLDLCSLLNITLSDQEFSDCKELTNFSAFGRYGSEEWMEADATKENVQHWILCTQNLLSTFTL